mgnify:CR=1 FL=1
MGDHKALLYNEEKRIALIDYEKGKQFIIASGYDPTRKEGEQWDYGRYFLYNNNNDKAIMLDAALVAFQIKTRENFISKERCIEIATKAIGYIPEEDLEYFLDDVDLSKYETDYFFDKIDE